MTTPQLPFNPSSQDAWERLEAEAKAIPPMPHFWAAGSHAGILRRKDLQHGYNLLRDSIGGFGAYGVAMIPGLLTVIFGVAGFVSGLAIDAGRPGGVLGDDTVLTDGLPWPIQNTLWFAGAMAVLGYLMGHYVWQPLKWYNAAWGDVLAMDEVNGECHALLRTKVHRLVFCARQQHGYYRGNAKDGHIARAKILLRNAPATVDETGNIAKDSSWHPGGLSQCLMTDLYDFAAGAGRSTDDPGRLYEALRVQMRDLAAKARLIELRGRSQMWKLENGLVLLAIIFVVAGLLQMMSITGGGDAIVAPNQVIDHVPGISK